MQQRTKAPTLSQIGKLYAMVFRKVQSPEAGRPQARSPDIDKAITRPNTQKKVVG